MAKNQDVLETEHDEIQRRKAAVRQAEQRAEQPTEHEEPIQAPKGSKDRVQVRAQKIALVQRQEDGTVRLSFEPNEHGANPAPMMLSVDAGKNISEGDDRGYLAIFSDGSFEWKPSAEIENNQPR